MSKDADQSDLPPSGDAPSPLWRRIKEHRIAQWSVGYVAVAYGIQHAVTLTSEAYDWPNIVVRVSMTLLALGLPIAMTLAWYHGERATHRVSAGEFAIISILLGMGAFLFYIFVRPEPVPTVAAATVRVASASVPAKATSAPISIPSGPSVAVLPLLNLSGDPKEEYFSDGVTEEITSALAKIPNLPVVARTSAFAFKGKNEDVRTIGQTLGANYVIEGSVRKAGDRVRITAQLIKAATGDHVWTDSYDRDLKDIFAVQEDVAKAIAAALQVPLGLKQGESLVSNRDIDPESYQNYLRAEALFRSRSVSTPLTPAIMLLESVVARQPNYAPAWALLAETYALAPNYDRDFLKGSVEQVQGHVDVDFPKAEAAARRAIALDPRNANAYAALGLVQRDRHKRLDSEQSYEQALSLDPLNPETLQLYGIFLAETGHIKQAVAVREQLRSLEPLVPVYNLNTALILAVAGNTAKALAIAQALPSDDNQRPIVIAIIYADMGRYKEAADATLNVPRELLPPRAVETAARLLRMAPTAATRENISDLGILSFVFAYVGLPERALDFVEHIADAGYMYSNFDIFWQSDYAGVRKTEQFKALVRKIGLVDYWHAKGWPDLCHPTTGDDFECS